MCRSRSHHLVKVTASRGHAPTVPGTQRKESLLGRPAELPSPHHHADLFIESDEASPSSRGDDPIGARRPRPAVRPARGEVRTSCPRPIRPRPSAPRGQSGLPARMTVTGQRVGPGRRRHPRTDPPPPGDPRDRPGGVPPPRPRPSLSSRLKGAKTPDGTSTPTGKGVRPLKSFDDYIAARRPEAWALLRKGGLSGQIARAFLRQHGTV